MATVLKTFGTMLSEHRKRAHLSQSDLAKRATISVSYVSQIESSKRVAPARPLLYRLAHVLKLNEAETETFVARGMSERASAALDKQIPAFVRELIAGLHAAAPVLDIDTAAEIRDLLNRQSTKCP
jgi:transcriptional regulator with XRE-family HTH domain